MCDKNIWELRKLVLRALEYKAGALCAVRGGACVRSEMALVAVYFVFEYE